MINGFLRRHIQVKKFEYCSSLLSDHDKRKNEIRKVNKKRKKNFLLSLRQNKGTRRSVRLYHNKRITYPGLLMMWKFVSFMFHHLIWSYLHENLKMIEHFRLLFNVTFWKYFIITRYSMHMLKYFLPKKINWKIFFHAYKRVYDKFILSFHFITHHVSFIFNCGFFYMMHIFS